MTEMRLGKRAQRKLDNAKLNNTGVGSSRFMTIAGIGGLVVLVAGYQFVQLLGGMLKPIGVEFVQPTDEAFSKALTNGEPYVVYCTDESTEEQPVPKIVSDIQKLVVKNSDASDTKFISTNCFKPRQSGKTLAEEYNFGKNAGFLGIFANQESPRQLNWLQSADGVSKQITPMIKPTMTKVTYLRDFDACRDRKSCLILSSPKREELAQMEVNMRPYVKEFRGVKMATVDTGFYNLEMDYDFLKTHPKAEGQEEETEAGEHTGGICIVRTEAPTPEKGLNGTDNYVAANPGKWIAAHMPPLADGASPAEFLELCQQGGNAEWYSLTNIPDIKAKPSEPKVVNAGGGKWQKERVGSRPEDVSEEDLDALDENEDDADDNDEDTGSNEDAANEEAEDVDM